MTNEPEALREIHDIRLRIFEETKDMTPQERANRTNTAAAKLAQQYGMKFAYGDIDTTDSRHPVSVEATTYFTKD